MTDHTPEITQCPDGLTFDPEPWLTSGMAASCQARFWGEPKFHPRPTHCQEQAHYPNEGYRVEVSTPPGEASE